VLHPSFLPPLPPAQQPRGSPKGQGLLAAAAVLHVRLKPVGFPVAQPFGRQERQLVL
jgi:hypothetical protein